MPLNRLANWGVRSEPAVARQAYTAELPQHQRHHKGPGAARRSARRAMGICTRSDTTPK